MIDKYKIYLDDSNESNRNSQSVGKDHNELPGNKSKVNNIVNKESICSVNSKNDKQTKLLIKLKSKFQNDNNFFFSILKANGESISNKDFTQNYSISDINSFVSEKKNEIASKYIY